jgi:ABC-type amino acid transport substrate-binding protein
MHVSRFLQGLCIGFLLASVTVSGQPTNTAVGEGRELIVATKEAPPFALKAADGRWTGLSIELWERLAAELNLEFAYREMPLPEMLTEVEHDKVDAAVSALTVTPDRENYMDFTHPYYEGGLGMAVSAKQESLFIGVLNRLFSWQFFSAVGALVPVLLLASFCVWLFERRANPKHFGGTRLQGLGAGFWWSAVTMTTVGYGDKAPKTLGGRVVALVWMFASIIVISAFTAGIASSLTASQMAVDRLQSTPIQKLTVATVAGSTGEAFASSMGARIRSYPDTDSALEAVHRGEAQAIVHDLPLLRYHAHSHPEWAIQILPRTLVRESYAIALPTGSPLREPLNRKLLEVLRSPEWQALRLQYVGSQ